MDAVSPAENPVHASAAALADSLTAADLEGEYRVAGIDGAPLDEGFGIAVSIGNGHVTFEPTCIGFDWTIADQPGGGLNLQRFQPLPPATGEPPPPVCAVKVHPAQARLGQVFDAVDHAARTPENGILLTGAGRSVTLFAQ